MYHLYWIAPVNSTCPKTEGYIGISNNPEKRFRAHTTDIAEVGSKVIRAYVAEHGISSVQHKILDSFNTLEEAREAERSYRPNAYIGWNVKTGGGISPDCTDRILSDESKEKIRQSNITTKSTRTYTNKFKGTTGRYTEEQRKHIGSFHKGKTISEEHRKAISEKLSGDNSPRARSIRIMDTLDGTEYSFYNLKTAAEELGITYSTLRSTVRNGRKLVYKRWEIL